MGSGYSVGDFLSWKGILIGKLGIVRGTHLRFLTRLTAAVIAPIATISAVVRTRCLPWSD